MTLLHFQILSGALFCIGLYGVLARRSAVLILLAIELMLNAVNINLISFAAYSDSAGITGQVIAIFVITGAAAEVGLALAIILRLFRTNNSVDIEELDLMKW
jgi:NADH:ubiquinone oxidoreductase subunit K